MSSSDDGNISKTTLLDAFWALALFLIMLGIGLYLLWLANELDIKQATLDASMILRYVQYPFTLVGTDSYSKMILELPKLKVSVTAASMSNGLFFELLAICFRSIAILLLLVILPSAIYKLLNREKILFIRDLSINDLIGIQREFYPRIKPATAVNLWYVNSRFGPWGSHLNFIDICIDRNFLSLESRKDLLSQEEIISLDKRLDTISLAGLQRPKNYQVTTPCMTFSKFKGLNFPTGLIQAEHEDVDFLYDNIHHYCGALRVKKEDIHHYYLETLGERCRYKGRIIDADYLPPSERVIWMLLCAIIPPNAKIKDRINKILDKMGDTFIEGTYRSEYPDHSIDFSDVMEVYNEVKDDPRLKIALVDIASSHAYYYTAFTRLFIIAKERYSRLITRDFHWLYTVNRTLYNTLNQVGIEVARPETAGIRCHFKAEIRANKKITQPVVDGAVKYFMHSLHSEGYTLVSETEINAMGRPYWNGTLPIGIEDETEEV
jgi:hypothetical protein